MRWRLPKDIQLIKASVFAFLILNVVPNHLFILTDCRDPVASCPEVLPGKIRSSTQVVSCNVDRALSFDESYDLVEQEIASARRVKGG